MANDFLQGYQGGLPNDTASQDTSGGNDFLSGYEGNTQTPQQSSSGSVPKDVQNAASLSGNTDYNGLCEAFVEQEAGLPNMGGSASDAWDNWVGQGKGRTDMQNAKPGDLIYFSDPNNEAGHTGIYEGNNKFISATDNGVATYDLGDWTALTGQSINGYVPMGGQ